MKGIVLLFSFLIAAAFRVEAQSDFYKIMPGLGVKNNYDVKVVASPDGGWITGGTIIGGIKLIKYDKCGILEWSKFYPTGIYCFDIVASKFGGYAITGTSPSILRIDDNGNVIFGKIYYSSSSFNWNYSIGEDDQGNLFIHGISMPCVGCTSTGNNYTIKTDSLGNILWSKIFARSTTWTMPMVCSDGGVLRAGGFGDIYKIDSSGALVWANYGYTSSQYKPIEVSDGYIFASFKSTRSSVFKIDLNGNFLWRTQEYLSPTHWVNKITVTDNGHVIATNSNFVIEFNSSGEYLKHNYFKNPITNAIPKISDICTLKDQSFLISGFDNLQSFNCKIDPSLLSCADTYVPLDTISPYPCVLGDTMYTSSNISFTTSSFTLLAPTFDPLEESVCANYDSLNFVTSFPDTICNGELIILSVTDQSNSNVAWNWYADNCGGILIGTGLSVNVSPESTETYFIEAKGCDTTACIPMTVNVLDKPIAAFQEEYFVDCKGIRVDLINESTDADSYIWNFTDGYTDTQTNISHDLGNSPSFEVSLIAINNNLCRDTLTIQNSLSSFQDYFTFPNVFTPNNDGVNDQLGIITNADLSDCFSIKIFDRWGLELFASKSINLKWDGRTTSGQKAAQGTYFYLLEINDIEYKGQITLLE